VLVDEREVRPLGYLGRSGKRLVRGLERRMVTEDRLIQTSDLWSGIDTELFGEVPPQSAVRGQRCRLASAPIERNHELSPQTFPQRMLLAQRFEFGDDLSMVSEPKLCLEPILRCARSELLESRYLRPESGVIVEVGIGGAVP
jgi:hypothetical protein